MVRLLSSWNFLYVGYQKSAQTDTVMQGTDIVQSWIPWDFGQPNTDNGECITIFTYNWKFHDCICSTEAYALCSTPYQTGGLSADPTANLETEAIPDQTTDVNTHRNIEVTNKRTTDVTTNQNTDVNTDRTFGVTTDVTTASSISPCCHCCVNPVVNITHEELQKKIDILKKETKVNEENLSSTIRKRTSASDPRPTSAYVGYLGIGFLTVAFGGVFLLDLPRLFVALKTFC
ncbi:uncharacterized protein LOC117331091 [Pecten maximus]|uniref:uncharacterized protein LOC117331091 n=1 Tax=Pecten maximus TaxID=6579 RepID=UPI0014585EB2|nr:uncharacterized protein LOC117331091 [Pecten maximus]